MVQHVVIQKSDNKVLRYGFSDFENDGQYNSEIEEIIESSYMFKISLDEQDYHYNPETETFYLG